jgi:hypothetical protein
MRNATFRSGAGVYRKGGVTQLHHRQRSAFTQAAFGHTPYHVAARWYGHPLSA